MKKIGNQRNSNLAYSLAEIYKEIVGHEFPGGPGNACIGRTRAGRFQTALGAWSWSLDPIYFEFCPLGSPAEFGSALPATECLKLYKNGNLDFYKTDHGLLGQYELMEKYNEEAQS